MLDLAYSRAHDPPMDKTLASVPRTSQLEGRSRVAVAACPSYAPDSVKKAVAELADATGGPAAWIQPGQTVLLKPNLFSPHPPEDAVTTHPEIVRQMIRLCVQAKVGRIWVGDSPVGLTPEAELWSRTGMTRAVEGTPAELKSWAVKQTPVTCDGDVLALPEWYSQVDVVISLAKLKAHCLTTLTGALKNVYGLVNGPAKSQFHLKYPSPVAMSGFLVRVFAALKPHLTIMDAVTAMEGNGPAHGHPRPVGVLLASRDAVALDAVVCSALAISPRSVPMIRMAADRGLGRMEEPEIDRVGSGADQLWKARLRPSLSRYIRHIPEWAYALTPHLLRLRPGIREAMCVRCGTCAAICPRKAIREEGSERFPRISQSDCIGCFCCLESCPRSAIVARLYLGTLLRLGQKGRQEARP